MEIDPRLRAGAGAQSQRHHPTTSTTTDAAGSSETRNGYIPPHSPDSRISSASGYGLTAHTGSSDAAGGSNNTIHGEYYPDSPGHTHAGYTYYNHAPSPNLTTNTPSPHPPATTEDHDNDNDNDEDGNENNESTDLRRPRACESCRTLKVRCEPNTTTTNAQNSFADGGADRGGPCRRCAKTGRQCVVTRPSRKRVRKTDGRVAELERKIDTLTARLVKQPGGGGTPGAGVGAAGVGAGVLPQGVGAGGAGRRWLGARQSMSGAGTQGSPLAGTKREYSGEVKDNRSCPEDPAENTAKLAKLWSNPGPPPAPETGLVDPIDQGVVSLEAALETFDRYNTEMVHHLPIVVFPPGTRMHEIRRSKPILFHAILAVSIGPTNPGLSLPLINEFYKLLAERVILCGEKSLELVQALIVACTWYVTPDHCEELKFYQLIHMAVTLAMDIGLFRRTRTGKKSSNVLKDIMGKKAFLVDLDSPETRRTWLGCYYLSVQVSAALRRVPLVRWHPYMDECLEILETSADSLPSDKALIQLVKLAQITEEVGFHFSNDEPDLNATFSESKTQFTLKAFERQLDKWRRETPAEHYSLTMQHSDYLLNIYIHEPTMHIDSLTDSKHPTDSDTEIQNNTTSPAYISALSTCLSSVHHFLNTTLTIPTHTLPNLPTYVLARVSYAMVALIRLYAIITGPETQIATVIDPGTLRVEYYLEAIVGHYRRAGEVRGGRAPGKFAVLLDLLRNWFVKQKTGSGLKEVLAGEAGNVCPEGRHGRFESLEESRAAGPGVGVGQQTPLHLLSEVAMGEPKSNRPGSNPNHLPSSFQRGSWSTGYTPTPTSDPTSIDSLITPPDRRHQQHQPWVNQYPPPPPPTSATAYQHQTTPTTYYPNTTNSTVLPDQSAAAVSEFALGAPAGLGFGFGFEPENLFSLGDMLGDGFFNFPFVGGGSTGGTDGTQAAGMGNSNGFW